MQFSYKTITLKSFIQVPGLHCHWNRSHTIELFLTIFPQDESAALWGSGMTVLVVFVGVWVFFGGGREGWFVF